MSVGEEGSETVPVAPVNVDEDGGEDEQAVVVVIVQEPVPQLEDFGVGIDLELVLEGGPPYLLQLVPADEPVASVVLLEVLPELVLEGFCPSGRHLLP
jgi:hypothetical protein